MRQQKKPFKFYLIIFLASTLIIAGYSLYMILVQDRDVSELYSLWVMPVIFTLFYYGSDVLMFKIFNRKNKKVSKEDEFLQKVSQKMRDSNEFLVEEFRQLQLNKKIQEDLKRALFIYENGESEVFKISKLENKYKEGTLEQRAVKYIIEVLKENQENNMQQLEK